MKSAWQLGILSLIVICFVTVSGAWYISSGLLQPVKTECDKKTYTYCGTPAELGLRYRNTTIKTVDDVTISAWYIQGRENYPGIVLIPGIGGTRHVGLRYAPSLHAAGFNLLLIELRNSGKSGGYFNSMGYHERKDVHAAVNHLLYRRRVSSAGVFGFSTGAGIAILAMAENKNIKVGVFESGFTDFDSLVKNEQVGQYGFKASLLYPLTASLFEFRAQAEIETLNPLQAIPKISPRPVFIIHGGADPVVEFEQGKSLYVAAKPPKQFWPVFKSGHVQSWQTDKERAEKDVPSFFVKYLKFPKPPPEDYSR